MSLGVATKDTLAVTRKIAGDCAFKVKRGIDPATEKGVAKKEVQYAASHADKYLNNVAGIWNGILRAAGKAPPIPLDASDVANLIEGLKIARRYTGSTRADDYVNGARVF